MRKRIAEEELLEGIKKLFKDKWVSANQVATTFSKSGEQARKNLERLSETGLLERDQKCCVCYRVDPPDWKGLFLLSFSTSPFWLPAVIEIIRNLRPRLIEKVQRS